MKSALDKEPLVTTDATPKKKSLFERCCGCFFSPTAKKDKPANKKGTEMATKADAIATAAAEARYAQLS